jgi:hypothetical protein
LAFYQDLQLSDGKFSIDYHINLLHYFVNVIEMLRLIYVLQLNDNFVQQKSLQETKNMESIKI